MLVGAALKVNPQNAEVLVAIGNVLAQQVRGVGKCLMCLLYNCNAILVWPLVLVCWHHVHVHLNTCRI